MQFFSPVGQDRFLLENFFRGKRRGVFVDIGAYDGTKFSNSLFFERYMGWTGLCIEPQPAAFEKLAASRRAQCLRICVSDFEGEADFVECEAGVDAKMLSGLERSFDSRHQDRLNRCATGRRTLKVPVRKLSDILAEQGLGLIDYCSIDVEGAERNILTELDLDRFPSPSSRSKTTITIRRFPS
jgi:FkbM family methyltransferase